MDYKDSAPMADFEDAEAVSEGEYKVCIRALECGWKSHDEKCPKFEDNSHAMSEREERDSESSYGEY